MEVGEYDVGGFVVRGVGVGSFGVGVVLLNGVGVGGVCLGGATVRGVVVGGAGLGEVSVGVVFVVEGPGNPAVVEGPRILAVGRKLRINVDNFSIKTKAVFFLYLYLVWELEYMSNTLQRERKVLRRSMFL